MSEVLENWQRQLDSAASPAAKSKIYESLLTDFPLLFGYWIQYAEHVALIAGPLSAKDIYERATAAIPTCVTLWISYLDFALRNPGDFDQSSVLKLFKTAEIAAGRDFYSHPLWDKHIEYVTSIDPSGRSTADVLIEATKYPLHQYARYFEHLSNLSGTFPDLVSHVQRFSQIQQATNDIWTYESQITQNYFNVLPIPEALAKVWNDYLDYLESSEFDTPHVQFVYERCLVVLAHYPEFWRKYFQWSSETESEEFTRNVLRRGVRFTKSTALKLTWSLFEELHGHPDASKDILEALIDYLGNSQAHKQKSTAVQIKQQLQDAYTYLFNLQKRQHPQAFEQYLDSLSNEYSYGYKAKYSQDPEVLVEGLQKFPNSVYLHTIKAELGQSDWSDVLKSPLPGPKVDELAPGLVDKLCGKPEWIQADYETFGPASVQRIKAKATNGHVKV